MTNPNDPNDFLFGGGSGKSAFGKDDPIGTYVQGPVISAELRNQTDIKDGSVLTWDDGSPKQQLVVALQTDKRESEDDEGVRNIYVKGSKAPGSKSMHDAVRSAIQAAGANRLDPGGILAVQFIGTEPSTTRGFSDKKLYQAHYTPPNPAAASEGFLQAPVQQAPQQQYQQPAPPVQQQYQQPAPPVQQQAPQQQFQQAAPPVQQQAPVPPQYQQPAPQAAPQQQFAAPAPQAPPPGFPQQAPGDPGQPPF